MNEMSVYCAGGMILTGLNRNTRRKICASATNLSYTGLGSNLCLRYERPATSPLNYGSDDYWEVSSGLVVCRRTDSETSAV